MPARAQKARLRRIKSRRRSKAQRAKGNKRRARVVYFFLAVFLVLSVVFLQSKFWDDTSRLALVVNAAGGEHILLSVFDPEKSEITNIFIPRSTEVSVARALGTWQLGSVWELGKNENLDGRLLSETITYHFNLPVVAWADTPAAGFSGGSLYANARAAFLPYKTNLKTGDKIRIALYSVGVKSFKRRDVYLENTSALAERVLKSGEKGYVFKSRPPGSILILFSDERMSKTGDRVVIKNFSGKPYLSEVVAEVLDVLGGKVTSTTRQDVEDFDCEIVGRQRRVITKVALIFDCEEVNTTPSGSFDLEVRIGKRFGERF